MIYVDTSFWYALLGSRDSHHEESQALLSAAGTESLITSNSVRGETWTLLRRRYGHRPAVSFLDRLERSPRLRVVFVSEAQEAEASRWLRRHDEREYSFVDATSFAVMRALRIGRAFAFDGDFNAAGFVELRAS